MTLDRCQPVYLNRAGPIRRQRNSPRRPPAQLGLPEPAPTVLLLSIMPDSLCSARYLLVTVHVVSKGCFSPANELRKPQEIFMASPYTKVVDIPGLRGCDQPQGRETRVEWPRWRLPETPAVSRTLRSNKPTE